MDTVPLAVAQLEEKPDSVPVPVGQKLPKLHRGLTVRGQENLAIATGSGIILIAGALGYVIEAMTHVH
ncbi:hypothetical protein GCM10022287_23450 [Gryllotalpicola koreensis]|uniref:Uncharacterized protein n=2 Tax=Gryllotalpicola koreensis TaxID=993086 RepID=A0ABP8A2N3_9MICO